MPIGHHRSGKPQVWNGSGMASLSPSQRRKAMENAADRAREQRTGWPSSVQREGEENKHTYRLADAEWAKRMAASKLRC
jgi:hypothetical protein